MKISGITDDIDRITTVTQVLCDVPVDFAANLDRIFHQLNLTEDSQVVLLDSYADEDAFTEAAMQLGAYDEDSNVIDDEDDLIKLGWSRIESNGNSVAYIKDGAVYTYNSDFASSKLVIVVEE